MLPSGTVRLQAPSQPPSKFRCLNALLRILLCPQPKAIHLSVGVCSCIRSTLSDHNPDAPLTLNLKGLHGQSSLNDLGIAVQEAIASQVR